MRLWRAVALLVTVSVVASAPCLAADAKTSVLRLPTGDFLPGTLVDSDAANTIGWQCPFAVEPFQFPLSAVGAAHFLKSKNGASAADADAGSDDGGYSVEFVGGDLLTGRLIGLSGSEIEIENESLGRIIVDRSHVERLSRGGLGGSFHYRGPDGLAAWKPFHEGDKVEHWTEESGQLVTNKPGEIVLKELPIPARAWIEVDLSWKSAPSFKLVFGGNATAPPTPGEVVHEVVNGRVVARPRKPAPKSKLSLFSIETWDRSLVLVREGKQAADIAEAMTLPTAGSVQLRIYYDDQAGSVSLYSADRKLLAKVAVPSDPKLTRRRGVRLANGMGDLRLEHLAVRDWDGTLPTEADHDRPHVRRKDGAVAYADDVSFDAETDEFVIKEGDAEPTRLASREVDYIYFNSAQEPTENTARVTLLDGVRISGQLAGVRAGRLQMTRGGVKNTLDVPVEQLRSLASLVAYQPESAPAGRIGRMEVDGSRHHGKLIDSAEESAESCLVWRPHGSTTSSPLVRGLSGSIVYRDPPPPVAREPQAADRQPARPVNKPGLLNLFNLFGVRNERSEPASLPTTSGSTELIWLRGGDRLPCRLRLIDERGVQFESPMAEAQFLPHEAVKAWERQGGAAISDVDAKKRERLLTLPRMQRNNPPTHLVESQNGDFLRGRLESLDDKTLRMEVRLEPKEIRRDALSRVIWLDPPESDATQASDASTAGRQGKSAKDGDAESRNASIQAVRSDGIRLTFVPSRVRDDAIEGRSELLGACQVAVNDVDQFILGEEIQAAAREQLYHDWRLRPAPDPRFASESSEPGKPAQTDSRLVGNAAPDFTLKLLAGGDFQLSQQRGQVVVLDFWASWCGPCMQSMPQLEELAKELTAKDVRFFAVNLQEDRQTVADALERLNVSPAVVLDVDGAAAEKFAVSAIPQTVVIDREGKVAAVLIGAQPNLVETLRDAVIAACEQDR